MHHVKAEEESRSLSSIKTPVAGAQQGEETLLRCVSSTGIRLSNVLGVLGWVLAVSGLAWVVHDLNLSALHKHIFAIRWPWIALALIADLISYLCQGWRWQILLRPVGSISPLRSTQAIYAGLFVNEILPMRPGELVRAYLVSRLSNVSLLMIVPSMIAERIFDAIWLVAGIGLTAVIIPLPGQLKVGAEVLGAIVIVSLAIFVRLIFFRNLNNEDPASSQLTRIRWIGSVFLFIQRIGHDLGGMARTAAFYFSFMLSLAFLILQALAFWLVMRGCGLSLSFWTGATVFLLVHLGTAIPNTPANVGSYQFFTVLGLTLFGVNKSAATGFSFVVFVLLTLPLLVLGFIAISASGMSLRFIRREAS